MTGGSHTALVMLVCTVLGAAAGFLAARWHAGKDGGQGVGATAPAHALDACDARNAVDEPPTVAAGAEETSAPDFRVVLPAHLTDAEIDALPPELPLLVRRRQRRSPPNARRFDRL